MFIFFLPNHPPNPHPKKRLFLSQLKIPKTAMFSLLKRLSPRWTPLDNYQDINPLPVTVVAGLDHSPPNRRAVVSSLYSDSFAIAVAVVGYSAKSANVSARLLLPYLEHKVSEKALCIARAVDIYPRFIDLYTKLNIWNLDRMGVDSAVYLDADTLVRRNFDELFDSPFQFAAVPDVYGAGDPRGFSITINTGVMAFRPSSAVYEDMLQDIEVAEYPLLQADQGFLNLYFGGTCMRLPYIYNANLAIKDRSPILWQRLTDEMRVVHYTTMKPFIHEARSSNAVLTPEETEEAVDKSERQADGFYHEEVGWWRTAYRNMMSDRGHVMRQCYQS
ncbi:glycosyltransferase family 8 protein [Mycena olivaceomarginata]|nr:glycosyltransferase family 8 protein [Mycena olivaceomarginata]